MFHEKAFFLRKVQGKQILVLRTEKKGGKGMKS